MNTPKHRILSLVFTVLLLLLLLLLPLLTIKGLYLSCRRVLGIQLILHEVIEVMCS